MGFRKKPRSPVSMYDIEGNLIRQFKSIQEASKELGVNRDTIKRSVLSQLPTSQGNAKGYVFRLDNKKHFSALYLRRKRASDSKRASERNIRESVESLIESLSESESESLSRSYTQDSIKKHKSIPEINTNSNNSSNSSGQKSELNLEMIESLQARKEMENQVRRLYWYV